MSKANKKKKIDADFDLAKEDEKIKKLIEQQEKILEEESGEDANTTAKNLFNQDLFTKAQKKDSKMIEKKDKKDKKESEVNKNVSHEDRKSDIVNHLKKKLAEANETQNDSSKEYKSEESEIDNSLDNSDDMEEDYGKEIVDEIIEEVEPQQPRVETRLPKKARPLVNIEEKSSEKANICLGLTILMLTGLLLYSKYNEERFQRMLKNSNGFNLEEDLYETLQIDPSASVRDIRKQYNKLALAWHPDKNPNCGEDCLLKFDRITKAYEILSDPEKRKNYDQNAGVFTPIKSKTISLTTNNYRRLVEEGNDLWIIQVFEDGDRRSLSLADLWEETAKSYGGIVKFGRININTQADVLKLLPYHIKIFPTIIAIVPGYYAEIFTPNHRNMQIALRKFIESCIATNIDYVDHDGYFKLAKQWVEQNESPIHRKPEVALFTDRDQTPLSYRYASFKLHKFFKFYQNKFGEALKIKKTLKTRLPDLVVQVDQLKTASEEIYVRKEFNFAFSKGINNDKFRAVFEFAKFHTIPELDKSIYTEFCGGDENLVEDEDSKNPEDENNKPSVCIILLKNSTTDLASKLKSINIFQKKNADDIFEAIQSNTIFFDNFKYIRFGIIDTEKQKKFGRLINELVQKNGHEYPSAVAVIHENQKYFVFDSSKNFGSFLNSVQNLDDSLESYYMSNVLKERHITELLFREEENIFSVLFATFQSNLRDPKVLLTLLLATLLNKFILKKSFFKSLWNGFLAWLVISLVLGVVHAYNEFL